jgi:hypothetical protein
MLSADLFGLKEAGTMCRATRFQEEIDEISAWSGNFRSRFWVARTARRLLPWGIPTSPIDRARGAYPVKYFDPIRNFF